MSIRVSGAGCLALLWMTFAAAATPAPVPPASAIAPASVSAPAGPQANAGARSPATPAAASVAVGSAFTYQGLLRNGGQLAQGLHDFIFTLYSDSTAGSQVGTAMTLLGVTVNNGFFTVALDYGAAAFDGNARWLDIQVRPAGGGSYTPLLPRQALRPSPYAVRAINGPTGSSQWVNDTYGIDYPNKVGIGTATNPTSTAWINSGTTNNNTLYVTSSNGPWAALAVRNYGSNGWGLYDDTSMNHYLYGRLGLGQSNPGYPADILNTLGGGMRIAATGSTLSGSYPGEGVRAALFVHGNTGSGVFGASSGGIYASSTDARAIAAQSVNDWGVSGDCLSAGTYGVLGTPNEGVFGWSPNTSKPAARFNCASGGVAIEANGIAKVKTLQILGGADLAEPFAVSATDAEAAGPGAVVVIDEAQPGQMKVSDRAYDTRVAGVISGAHDLAPGMVMKAEGAEHGGGDHPVALTGRVWCKVDASFGAVRPGDLLTTSPTPGHAMLARDGARRAGAIIGKAMTSLEGGRGLVLVLVSLQ